MENCKINEATKDYWEEYQLFKELNKDKGKDYIELERFLDYKEDNEILTKNGKETLTYEQWYITIKSKERKNAILRAEQRKIIQLKENFKIFQQEELGYFHFNIYKDLLLLDLEPQYLTRFVYLCCFLDFDDSRVKWGKIDGGNAIVKDLEEILGLSERECRNTKNALIKKGLITIDKNNIIEINKKYAFKGKSKKDMEGCVKMFENGFKQIYENATPKEHKKLGILIKLLPSVNYAHNILCSNPEETDVTKIYPLSLKDICNIVGYAEKNSSRLKKELLNLTVNDELVVKITQTKYGIFIYINPHVYYKGHDIDGLKGTINEFRIGKDIIRK